MPSESHKTDIGVENNNNDNTKCLRLADGDAEDGSENDRHSSPAPSSPKHFQNNSIASFIVSKPSIKFSIDSILSGIEHPPRPVQTLCANGDVSKSIDSDNTTSVSNHHAGASNMDVLDSPSEQDLLPVQDADNSNEVNEDNELEIHSPKTRSPDGNAITKYDVDSLFDDVTTSVESYVNFPLALHCLRSRGLAYGGRTLLPGATAWSTALMNDIRKERYNGVRRVGHPYQNRTPPKRKKPRTSFTRVQTVELEKRFTRQKYLASTERSTLAKSLKMSDAQVKTWFQNRRTKWRRQTAEERELERQAANRLLLSLQSGSSQKQSLLLSPDSTCLSQLQRFQEHRVTDS